MHGENGSIFWKEDSSRDPLTQKVIGAAIEVHRALGPGLLESTYEECLCHELELVDLSFVRQLPMPIQYKNKRLNQAYKLDTVVEQQLIIELKAGEKSNSSTKPNFSPI